MKKFYFCRVHTRVSGKCECIGDFKLESFLWCDPIGSFKKRLQTDLKFYELTQYYMLRNKSNDDSICDIYKTIAVPITNVPGGYSF